MCVLSLASPSAQDADDDAEAAENLMDDSVSRYATSRESYHCSVLEWQRMMQMLRELSQARTSCQELRAACVRGEGVGRWAVEKSFADSC